MHLASKKHLLSGFFMAGKGGVLMEIVGTDILRANSCHLAG